MLSQEPSDESKAGDGDGDGDVEEGVKVALRMRPLNAKEGGSLSTDDEDDDENDDDGTGRRVWRVLQKYHSVTQTTPEGQPLSERAVNRTFFSYDATFGEDSTTADVYGGIARGLVEGVVGGLNGTVFAYGQTSSGKTYTMQGDGIAAAASTAVEGGGADTPPRPRVEGIIQMAARDIFSCIHRTSSERTYLLRVSFIEIYNEEVRDLLVSGDCFEAGSNVLHVREDGRRGVFVNANETIVTDFDGLMGVLFAGEKNRSVGSTSMNERSSRSHTIFRITVESRHREGGGKSDESSGSDDDDGEGKEEMSCSLSRMGSNLDEEDDDGAVLVSTLNLVDLAGSESVRHTGATGERQREGGKINQSLLTLSRVIAGLGQADSRHINFRDSKLTRILQPSLSGNARMAVICCATPSELYLEETRSTLQFASRAKLVKTHAVVNEVLDDRSTIRKLRRELAEEKRNVERAEARVEEMEAQLKGEGIDAGSSVETREAIALAEAATKRSAEHGAKSLASEKELATLRAEGVTAAARIKLLEQQLTDLAAQSEQTEKRSENLFKEKEREVDEMRVKKFGLTKELKTLRESEAAASEKNSELERRVSSLSSDLETSRRRAEELQSQLDETSEERSTAVEKSEQLEKQVAEIENKRGHMRTAVERLASDKEKAMEDLGTIMEQHMAAQETVRQETERGKQLEAQNTVLTEELDTTRRRADDLQSRVSGLSAEKKEATGKVAELEQRTKLLEAELSTAAGEKEKADAHVRELAAGNSDTEQLVSELIREKNGALLDSASLSRQLAGAQLSASGVEEEKEEAERAKVAAERRAAELEAKNERLVAEKARAVEDRAAAEGERDTSQLSFQRSTEKIMKLEQQVASLLEEAEAARNQAQPESEFEEVARQPEIVAEGEMSGDSKQSPYYRRWWFWA